MVQCFVPDCNHQSERNNCNKFFRFPSNKKEKKRWVHLIRRQDKEPTSSSRVCSCHFRDGDRKNCPEIFERNKNKLFPVNVNPSKKIRLVKTASSDITIDQDNVVPDSSEPLKSIWLENQSWPIKQVQVAKSNRSDFFSLVNQAVVSSLKDFQKPLLVSGKLSRKMFLKDQPSSLDQLQVPPGQKPSKNAFFQFSSSHSDFHNMPLISDSQSSINEFTGLLGLENVVYFLSSMKRNGTERKAKAPRPYVCYKCRSGVSSCWLKKSKRKISCLKCDVAIKKLRIRQDLYRLQVEKQANKTPLTTSAVLNKSSHTLTYNPDQDKETKNPKINGVKSICANSGSHVSLLTEFKGFNKSDIRNYFIGK